MAPLEAVATDQALGKERILGVQPVIDPLVDDEGPAVGEVDIAAVQDRLLGGGRLGEDEAQKLLSVGQPLEGDLGLPGEDRELRQGQPVELVQEQRLSRSRAQVSGQGVQGRKVRVPGGRRNVSVDRRGRRGWRLLREGRACPRGALLPALPKAAPLVLAVLPKFALLPVAASSGYESRSD